MKYSIYCPTCKRIWYSDYVFTLCVYCWSRRLNVTIVGSATKAMFKAILGETYERAAKYFHDNPEVRFAYWGKDEFLSCDASEEERKAFIDRHPEISDLEDHTTVTFLNDVLILATFCPRLKAGVEEIYESGDVHYENENYGYNIEQDKENNNYKCYVYKK